MSMKKTLGGERLGSGKKMQVELHNYERSTHDKGYLWRSTMSPGTLVPFLSEVIQPGDTWDIDLNAICMTHPTVGPLFGSFKIQLDIFECPVRLYQGQLHNNKLNIGLNMGLVKLPQITLEAGRLNDDNDKQIVADLDNCQINPSALLAYLGIRGVGQAVLDDDTRLERNFYAIPLLGYWDIVKNYYINKQEENAAMIFTIPAAIDEDIDTITINNTALPAAVYIENPAPIVITWTGTRPPDYAIIFNTSNGEMPLSAVAYPNGPQDASPALMTWKWYFTGNLTVTSWRYIRPDEIPNTGIQVVTYPTSTLDDMREAILSKTNDPAQFIVNDNMEPDSPYAKILTWVGSASPYMGTQQGLALKTYQSDLFNNWLETESIVGPDSITDITKISTIAGSFTIDEFQLHKKIYDYLNRVAATGGSYRDWIEAAYTPVTAKHVETPIYHGGLSKELIFQEVISNAESGGANGGVQPLGTLAGQGRLSAKHKGGHVTIKSDEWGHLIGIVSATPRIDYSQGNDWQTHLDNMGDFHVPAMDQIGFQDLIEEQMAWWSTTNTGGAGWLQLSAGKQPAWINYMTNVNRVLGNFAIATNEMFMVLTRRYEPTIALGIQDMTTYIDPTKYNHIFAQTSLDSQNLWMQISVDATVRRLISAKVMPTL